MAKKTIVDGYAQNLFGETPERRPAGPLEREFALPPFSVLDARSGTWQSRKRDWLAIGIRSELGRGSNLVAESGATGVFANPKTAARAYNMGLNASAKNGWEQSDNAGSGTSVFDPVLCEMVYRWYSPPGGMVVDPFAGGSVRGVVASHTGRRYWGCDLRAEQIAANVTQCRDLCGDPMPEYVVGDSAEMLPQSPGADLVFSCPPYGNLEIYSDHPADLSNMDLAAFRVSYARIITAASHRLRPDSFAVFVVGNYRRRDGVLVDLVGDTVAAFRDAGCHLWNEKVLVTPAGTMALRAGNQFRATRKICKGHQNVLVFVNGDGRRAAERCGVIGVD